jgi:hypothetical protein
LSDAPIRESATARTRRFDPARAGRAAALALAVVLARLVAARRFPAQPAGAAGARAPLTVRQIAANLPCRGRDGARRAGRTSGTATGPDPPRGSRGASGTAW